MGFIDRQGFLLAKLIKSFLPAARENGATIIVSKSGNTEEFCAGNERRKHMRFPVALSVRHGQELPLPCQDFVLNASEGGVFIQCDAPLPPETILELHFYLPPEEKLLAEFSGEVIETSSGTKYASGMHIKFFDYNAADMERFLAYLEENRHLLDIKI